MVGFDEYNVVHYAIKRVDWLSRELDYPPELPQKLEQKPIWPLHDFETWFADWV